MPTNHGMVVRDSVGATACYLSLLSLACTESTACSPWFHLVQARLNQEQQPNISTRLSFFFFFFQHSNTDLIIFFLCSYTFLFSDLPTLQGRVNGLMHYFRDSTVLFRGAFLWYMSSPAQNTHAVMYHLGDWQLALSDAIFSSFSAICLSGSMMNARPA